MVEHTAQVFNRNDMLCPTTLCALAHASSSMQPPQNSHPNQTLLPQAMFPENHRLQLAQQVHCNMKFISSQPVALQQPK